MDLFLDPERAIPQFCMAVSLLAIKDYKAGRKSYRTGQQICEAIADNWRVGHRNLASSVYRKTRWSLELHDKAKELAGSPPGPTEGDPT